MSRIISFGHYLPDNCLTNTSLANIYQLETDDQWIRQRTGIKQRFFAEEEELSDLAYKASQMAMRQANISPNEITTIIVATMSSLGQTPSIACQVQAQLQANNAYAFDISAACSGFVYGVTIADSLSRQSNQGYILLIGAEKMSQVLDFKDRSTSILFGDGAGAMLIQCQEDSSCIEHMSLHSDGSLGNYLTCNRPSESTLSPYLKMEGRRIFNFFNKVVMPSIAQLIQEAHLSLDAIDYFALHQANARFFDLMIKKYAISQDKLLINIDKVANLSAASIPVLLSQAVEEERILMNGQQRVLLAGFGGGLTWASMIIKL